MVKTGFLRKVRSFKRRACGFALSLVLAVGMLPVFNSAPVKADDSNGEKIYNDILNMGNVDPECLKNTSNPYGYAYDEPFYMYRPQNLVQFYNYDGGNATYATYNFKGKANNTDFIYKGLSAVNKIGDDAIVLLSEVLKTNSTLISMNLGGKHFSVKDEDHYITAHYNREQH